MDFLRKKSFARARADGDHLGLYSRARLNTRARSLLISPVLFLSISHIRLPTVFLSLSRVSSSSLQQLLPRLSHIACTRVQFPRQLYIYACSAPARARTRHYTARSEELQKEFFSFFQSRFLPFSSPLERERVIEIPRRRKRRALDLSAPDRRTAFDY